MDFALNEFQRDIISTITALGVDISLDTAVLLSRRCSSVEGAIEYFFNNPSIFVNNEIQINEIDITGKVTKVDSGQKQIKPPPYPPEILANTGQAGEIATMLYDLGYPVNEIVNAIKRCSTIEAAIEFLVDEKNDKTNAILKITCPLCITEEIISDMITLSCNHRFCKECFKNYTINKINDNQVKSDELVCPALIDYSNKLCSSSISVFEIQANIPEDSFLKYERFITHSYCESENMRGCPKCNEWYIDINNVLQDEIRWKKITCGRCGHIFCGKCGQNPHKAQKDQDLSCEKYATWMTENGKSDETFQKYVQEQKIFPCPSCSMYGALESGCKYMFCRCKTNYCALCGLRLNQVQHFSHFLGGPGCIGPFGTVCLGVTDIKPI
eukprot:gene6313-12772_t